MTATRPTLGRLAPVDLREIWTNEAGDFTPWLSQPENIALLGEAIDIELEVEAQEREVGPFRADILCKDTAACAGSESSCTARLASCSRSSIASIWCSRTACERSTSVR